MRRLGSGAGCGVPRAWFAPTPREAGGRRPGPLWGSAAIARLDVDSERRGNPAGVPLRRSCAVPEERSPGPKSRGGAPAGAAIRSNAARAQPTYPRACRRAAPLMSGGEICSHLGLFGAARQQELGCLTFESEFHAHPQGVHRAAAPPAVVNGSYATCSRGLQMPRRSIARSCRRIAIRRFA